MPAKGKRNSAASTYSSSKKRRERDLSPSSDSRHGSDSPPHKSKNKTNGSKPEQKKKENSESEEDEEEEEEEYEVDTIKSHKKERGVMKYLVGWKGYGSDKDTWEPVKHLSGAVDLLKQYQTAHDIDAGPKSRRASDISVKSAPKITAKGIDSDESDDDDDEQTSRKRKRSSQDKINSTIAPLRKNGTSGPTKADRDSVKNRKPVRSESEASDSESVSDDQWHARHKKLSSWEDLIRSVRTIEKPSVEDDNTSQKTREHVDDVINVCLLWKTGRVSWVSNQVARDKLPQKMLDFYEDHLQFSTTES